MLSKRELSQLVRKTFQKKRGAKTTYYADIDGETKSLKEWAEFFGISYAVILERYHRGVTGRELIAPPRTGDAVKQYIKHI